MSTGGRFACPGQSKNSFCGFLYFPIISCLQSAREHIYYVQMIEYLSELRQSLGRAHQAAGRTLRHLQRRDPMTPGSFYLQKRRCGKPGCRCARGELHEAWVISRSQGGSSRTLMVPAEQRARLRQLTFEYRRYQRARALLAKRQAQVLGLADRLAELRMVRWPEEAL
jgi:hypothetical protein